MHFTVHKLPYCPQSHVLFVNYIMLMYTYLINTLQLITAIKLFFFKQTNLINIFQQIPNIPKNLCRLMDLSDEKV